MFYLLSFGAYLLLLWIFGLNELFKPGNIFIPHDTFYPISDAIQTTAFGIFNSAFNYSNNLTALMVWAPDIAIVSALRIFFLNNTTQIFHLFLCIFAFFSLAFFSIHKVFQDKKMAALLTLCYCFSPYSSVLYSAGIIYQISTAICLGILPLFLFKLISFETKNIAMLVPLTVLLAFGLLFIYPAFLLIILTLSIIWHQEKFNSLVKIINEFISPKVILYILIFSLPFIFFIYLTISIGIDKGAILAGGTNTAIKGGIFYPLMQISAWGLYDIWSPRAILSFHSYFFENPYRILSITLIILFIYFLIQNKKSIPILFILFLAFFAKGPNPPLGDIFTFLINNVPFGYMIRSPDSKFGAFIAAWFVVAIYYLRSDHKKIILILTSLFLLSNLSGIFANGAISSNRGDSKTTTFIQDPEASNLIKLIENYSNTVVLGNFSSCTGEWYNSMFHTCHGAITTSVRRQVIPSHGELLNKNIKTYQAFPTLVLLNFRQKHDKSYYFDTGAMKDFIEVYKSENYGLYFKDSPYKHCKESYVFACVEKDKKFLVSIPEKAFKYYYPQAKIEASDEPLTLLEEISTPLDYKRLAFLYICILCYFGCIGLIIKKSN